MVQLGCLTSKVLPLQDTAAACSALELAVQKLQASIEFTRGDVAPHNALGDAHASWADRLSGKNAVAHLHQAVLAYQQAVHIDSTCSDAYIGIAEVHSKMGRLLSAHSQSEALQHFTQAAEAYRRVLQWPTKLGKFQERCEVRYNCACALALCSQQDAAMSLLSQLVQMRGVSADDLQSDTDLHSLQTLPTFLKLVHQMHSLSQ